MSTTHQEGNIEPQTIGPNNKKNDIEINPSPYDNFIKSEAPEPQKAMSLRKKIYTAIILGFPAIILIAILIYLYIKN
jgi:hypothetical protein